MKSQETFLYNSIQAIDDQCELNSIHQIRLQLVSTDQIGTLNQIDQLENICYCLECIDIRPRICKLTLDCSRIFVLKVAIFQRKF